MEWEGCREVGESGLERECCGELGDGVGIPGWPGAGEAGAAPPAGLCVDGLCGGAPDWGKSGRQGAGVGRTAARGNTFDHGGPRRMLKAWAAWAGSLPLNVGAVVSSHLG